MKKTMIGLGTLVAVLTVVALSTNASLAYRGDPKVQGANYTPERHEAMTKALQNKDYTVWKALMQNKGRVTQLITEANFANFVEAHNLALQGKIVEAQKIRSELGLGQKNGFGKGGMMSGGRNGRDVGARVNR